MTMRRGSSQRSSGFTIIELLVAMSLFLVILLGIYNMFDTNRVTYVSGTRKVDVQQNARVALDTITRELRMAGYFPENYPAPPTPPPVTPLLNAIQVATGRGLAVFGDLDGSGTSSVFLYCLSNGSILRVKSPQSGTGNGRPASSTGATYTCNGGDVLAENITTLQFAYYGGDNAPIPNPPNLPYTLDNEGLGNAPAFTSITQRGAVRTVVVTLVARESAPLPGREPQSITLTSSVRLRNLP